MSHSFKCYRYPILLNICGSACCKSCAPVHGRSKAPGGWVRWFGTLRRTSTVLVQYGATLNLNESTGTKLYITLLESTYSYCKLQGIISIEGELTGTVKVSSLSMRTKFLGSKFQQCPSLSIEGNIVPAVEIRRPYLDYGTAIKGRSA